MWGKTVNAELDEIRKVTNLWAAQIEQRGTTVSSSDWTVTGNLTLGVETLSGSTATALVTITGCGEITNTVTLANGEVLSIVRKVEV